MLTDMTWMMGLDSKSLLSLVSGSLSPLVLLDRSVFVVFVLLNISPWGEIMR